MNTLFRDFGKTLLRRILFVRFQHANMKVGHYISRFKRSRPHFTFQNTLTFDDCTKDSRGSSYESSDSDD